MSVSERERRVLHQRLAANLGEEPADTLMELLPRVAWSDLATKSDLEVLESRLTAQFHRDMVRQTWILAGTLLAGLGTLGGLLH